MVAHATIAAVMFDFTGTLATQTLRGWLLYPDVLDTLQQLKTRDLIVGVLSNFDHSLQSILQQLNLRDQLDVVLYAEEIGAYKPDAAAFHTMPDATGVPLAQTLYVGDAWDNDMAPCLALGIPCCWLCRRGTAPPPATGASLRGVITTLTDVLRYV